MEQQKTAGALVVIVSERQHTVSKRQVFPEQSNGKSTQREQTDTKKMLLARQQWVESEEQLVTTTKMNNIRTQW